MFNVLITEFFHSLAIHYEFARFLWIHTGNTISHFILVIIGLFLNYVI